MASSSSSSSKKEVPARKRKSLVKREVYGPLLEHWPDKSGLPQMLLHGKSSLSMWQSEQICELSVSHLSPAQIKAVADRFGIPLSVFLQQIHHEYKDHLLDDIRGGSMMMSKLSDEQLKKLLQNSFRFVRNEHFSSLNIEILSRLTKSSLPFQVIQTLMHNRDVLDKMPVSIKRYVWESAPKIFEEEWTKLVMRFMDDLKQDSEVDYYMRTHRDKNESLQNMAEMIGGSLPLFSHALRSIRRRSESILSEIYQVRYSKDRNNNGRLHLVSGLMDKLKELRYLSQLRFILPLILKDWSLDHLAQCDLLFELIIICDGILKEHSPSLSPPKVRVWTEFANRIRDYFIDIARGDFHGVCQRVRQRAIAVFENSEGSSALSAQSTKIVNLLSDHRCIWADLPLVCVHPRIKQCFVRALLFSLCKPKRSTSTGRLMLPRDCRVIETLVRCIHLCSDVTDWQKEVIVQYYLKHKKKPPLVFATLLQSYGDGMTLPPCNEALLRQVCPMLAGSLALDCTLPTISKELIRLKNSNNKSDDSSHSKFNDLLSLVIERRGVDSISTATRINETALLRLCGSVRSKNLSLDCVSLIMEYLLLCLLSSHFTRAAQLISLLRRISLPKWPDILNDSGDSSSESPFDYASVLGDRTSKYYAAYALNLAADARRLCEVIKSDCLPALLDHLDVLLGLCHLISRMSSQILSNARLFLGCVLSMVQSEQCSVDSLSNRQIKSWLAVISNQDPSFLKKDAQCKALLTQLRQFRPGLFTRGG